MSAVRPSSTRKSHHKLHRSVALVVGATTALAALSAVTLQARAAAAATSGGHTAQPTATSAAAIPAECQSAGDFLDVAWQGPTCEAHGKIVVRLRNGHGLTVAPPDTIAALSNNASGVPASAQAPATTSVACVNPSTHTHVELWYAHFAGQGDNVSGHVADLQTMFEQVDSSYVDYDSRYYNGPNMNLYVECDSSGNPIVHDIGLSTPIRGADFSTIVSDMQNQGHNSSLAHYWVWTDGNPTAGYAGQSSVIGDDSPGAGNAINSANAYSINYGFAANNGGASIFAHENGHAMGAVQLSAPDTTGAWHCTDGNDVMCYNDGGPSANAYTSGDCGNSPIGTALLDCHRDNYFNPCPAPGSYLSNHWDVASTDNAWLLVRPLPTETAFNAPPQSVIQGTSTMLSAFVYNAGCGGGTVTFTDSGGTIGTATVGSNGIASVSLASLALGNYSVSAQFNGSAYAAASATSNPATFSVVPAPYRSLAVMDVFGGNYPAQASSLSPVPDQWPGWNIARGMVMTPDGTGGYVLDGWGGVHSFGSAQPVTVTGFWSRWDITRGIVLRADGRSGYVLDAWGDLHPFGTNGDMPPAVSISGYWPGWDVARGVVLRSDGVSGYVLDALGGVHPFGGAPSVGISAYWPGWMIARGISLDPDGAGGYVLDGLGGLHPFGNAPAVAITAYWPNWDIARSVVSEPGNGSSGWVLDGFGALHPYGSAPSVAGSAAGYWPGQDAARVAAAS